MTDPYQIAALPTRRDQFGTLEVLLVTSRETRRWVIPKGWPWPMIADHEAAAGEAWEEGGVRGYIAPHIIGTYHYDKRRKQKSEPLKVLVFVLEVTEEAESWPEQAQRERRWFSLSDAAERVCEHELKTLLLNLAGQHG
jgi:ADP-ribose pyrophosphatase YjhB (NUDIX family)